jgi:tetratricopeptide (TPR) repeat protein
MTSGDNVFQITITGVEASNFEISVSSPIGEATSHFEINFSVEKLIDDILESRFLNDILIENGKKLFNLIFKDQILDLYKLNKNNLKGNESLKIKLEFKENAEDIAKLPWELIHDESHFLVPSGKVNLIRYIENFDKKPVDISTPLRILVIISRPLGDKLDPLVERESIIRGFYSLQTENNVIIDVLNPPTLNSLNKAVSTNTYHVLHFDGHGTFENEMGYLLFEDENMEYDFINSEIISNTLSSTDIKLIVLTACESSKLGRNMFSSVAPSLIQAGIPAVVAMQFSVPLSSAAKFAEHFYNSLAHYNSISKSVIDGRKAIYADRTWFMPTFYLSNIPDMILKVSERSEKFETNLYSSINEQYYEPFFVGREKNLVDISNSIASTRTNCTAIWGPGGIGKTALLRRYVLRQNWRFHGEVIWIDLRGGKSLLEIHKKIGAHFGLTIKNNKNLEYEILKLLSKNSHLIVFDNYEDVEEDEEILDYIKVIPRPTRIIITTRNSPSIISWKKIKLYKLSLDESTDLFCKLSEDIGIKHDSSNWNLITEICKFVDGHPLALILIVKMLESNPITVILDKIMKSPLKGIQLALDVSYNGLKHVEKLMVQRLSVFTSYFDEEAIKSVSGLDNYEDIKEELIRRSFIYFDGQKFSIHPVIKQYAYNKLVDKKKYHLKAAEYYQSKKYFFPMVDHIYYAEEWEDFVATMGELLSPLSLRSMPNMSGALKRVEMIYKAANEIGDDKTNYLIDIDIGNLYRQIGSFDKSLEKYEDAYNLAVKINDFEGKWLSLSKKVQMYAIMRRPEFIEVLNELEALIEDNYDEDAYSACLMSGADGYSYLGTTKNNEDYLQKAKSRYEEAIEILENQEKPDNLLLAQAYNSLGQLNMDFNDNKNALELLNKSLELKNQIGDIYGVSITLSILSNLNEKLGKLKAAKGNLNEIISISEKIQFNNALERTFLRLAKINISLEEYEEAAFSLANSIIISLGYKDDSIEAIMKEIENELIALSKKKGVFEAAFTISLIKVILESNESNKELPAHIFNELPKIELQIDKIPEKIDSLFS